MAKTLVFHHLEFYTPSWSDGQIRRWINRVGPELITAQMRLAVADLEAHGTGKFDINDYYHLVNRLEGFINPAPTTKDLALNGHDFMAMGFQGKTIGAAQRFLLEKVIDNPNLNTKEELKNLLVGFNPLIS